MSSSTPSSWQPGIRFQSSAASPLGAIRYWGYLLKSRGDGQGTRRRLGRYALVYSIRGSCSYWDELNGSRKVVAGDGFLLFPEVAHRYGGRGTDEWDEIFVVFEGPVFDLWRSKGLLDPKENFLHLAPIPYWRARIEACVGADAASGSALGQVTALQSLLADAMAVRQRGSREEPDWLQHACTALRTPGAQALRLPDLARQLGVSFETFRKQFTALMGVAPSAWRNARMVDEAGRLLAGSTLRGKEIARLLGFADEYHFSRRFKELTGLTPTAFRKRTGSPAPPE